MSRPLLVGAAILALSVSTAIADDAPGLFTRVRSTQRFVIVLIREGYDRSPSFRDLVDTLQRSNVIVLVQPAACNGGRIRSCLVSVTGSQRERHIRIKVDTRTSHDALVATIAHELQHAVEIAEHPEVIDAASAIRLYRQIGVGRCREGLTWECETDRAIAIEKKVVEELFARRRAPAPRIPPSAVLHRAPAPSVNQKRNPHCKYVIDSPEYSDLGYACAGVALARDATAFVSHDAVAGLWTVQDAGACGRRLHSV